MNLSGIGPSFHKSNQNVLNESIQMEQSKNLPKGEMKQTQTNNDDISAKAEQNFDSFSYAQQYSYDHTLAPTGADADLSKLDVQKAISDMEKDRVLQQYQFFVK